MKKYLTLLGIVCSSLLFGQNISEYSKSVCCDFSVDILNIHLEQDIANKVHPKCDAVQLYFVEDPQYNFIEHGSLSPDIDINMSIGITEYRFISPSGGKITIAESQMGKKGNFTIEATVKITSNGKTINSAIKFSNSFNDKTNISRDLPAVWYYDAQSYLKEKLNRDPKNSEIYEHLGVIVEMEFVSFNSSFVNKQISEYLNDVTKNTENDRKDLDDVINNATIVDTYNNSSSAPQESIYQKNARLEEQKRNREANHRAKQLQQLEEMKRRNENSIKAIENTVDEISNNISTMIQRNNSYDNYRQNVASLTSMSNSDDPEQIIREYNQNMVGLENEYNRRLEERLTEINTDVAKLKEENKDDPLADDIGTIGEQIMTASTQNKIAKEKQKSRNKLREEKRSRLKDIQKKLIQENEDKREAYSTKAAATVALEKEKYYEQMAGFYQCKVDGIQNNFSTSNTSWIDPYCPVIPITEFQTNHNVSSEELYKASVRKLKKGDAINLSYGSKLIDMAINKDPKNAEFYLHKAKFYDTNLFKKLAILKIAIAFEPNNNTLKEVYSNTQDLILRNEQDEFMWDQKCIENTFEGYMEYVNSGYTNHLSELKSKIGEEIKIYHENGKLKGIGYKRNDKEEGEWKYYHENGNLSEIKNFISGIWGGEYQTYYESGKLKSIISLTEDVGNFKLYYESGRLKGISDDGGIIKKYYYENGHLEMIRQKIQFAGEEVYEDKIYDKEQNGQLNSVHHWTMINNRLKWNLYDENMILTGTGYKSINSVAFDPSLEKIGEWKFYYKNGQLKSIGKYGKDSWKEDYGKKIGKWQEYHENSQLKSSGKYQNGIKTGKWKYYDSNGIEIDK